jgi:protoheme IX farnesyltransferase
MEYTSTEIQIASVKMPGLIKKFSIYAELAKTRITLFVALSTSVGYILQKGVMDFNMLLSSLGVFLLAAGSSAINHIQEKDYDKKMPRTKNRPIPSGNLSVTAAWLFSIIMIISGSTLLFTMFGNTALILGLVSLIWYNVIYTPMKLKNALAVFPGSVIGALPPVIGWICAGGGLLDSRAISLAIFFFIWHIPHFWLLLLMYSDQYEKAGYPVLTKLFGREQLTRITFSVIAAFVCYTIMIPIFMINNTPYALAVIFLLGIILILNSARIIKNPENEKKVIRSTFILINLYVLIVSILLSVDKLLL